MTSLKGNGAAQLINHMRKHGFNKDVDFTIGTVVAGPPSLKIRVDGTNLTLDADHLVIAQGLTKHTREIKIDGGAVQTIEFQDELTVGDSVILAEANGGQLYYVIDRAVTY